MNTRTFFCIDAHTCGNPVRVVAIGGPPLKGDNMLEKRTHFLEKYDWIRKGLMFEPRGHDMMSGSILYEPHNPDNDAAVLFIETSGCLPMCGHGTIGTVTVAIEQQLITPRTFGILRLESPAGLIIARYVMDGEKVSSVTLTNVPSYLAATDLVVDCPDLGPLKMDVAYGGNFYAIVDEQENFKGIQEYTAGDLIRWSPVIRKQLNEQHQFIHPEDDRIRGMSHVLWTGKPIAENATARGAVFYGNKAIDRSPCGTGTSARMAQWAANGKLDKGEPFIHESIIGSVFTGCIEDYTTVGDFKAIIPSIKGWAKIIGFNTILLDEDDPFVEGFQVI